MTTDVEPTEDDDKPTEDEQPPVPMSEQVRRLVADRRQRDRDMLDLMLSRRDDAA